MDADTWWTSVGKSPASARRRTSARDGQASAWSHASARRRRPTRGRQASARRQASSNGRMPACCVLARFETGATYVQTPDRCTQASVGGQASDTPKPLANLPLDATGLGSRTDAGECRRASTRRLASAVGRWAEAAMLVTHAMANQLDRSPHWTKGGPAGYSSRAGNGAQATAVAPR